MDGIIAGIGIRPNIDLAKEAGISVNNGIVVEEYLRSSRSTWTDRSSN